MKSNTLIILFGFLIAVLLAQLLMVARQVNIEQRLDTIDKNIEEKVYNGVSAYFDDYELYIYDE